MPFMLPFNIEDPRGNAEFDFESVVEYFKENGMWYSDEYLEDQSPFIYSLHL